MLLKLLPSILMTIPYIYQFYQWYYTDAPTSQPNIKSKIIEDTIKTIKDTRVVIQDVQALRQDIIDEYKSIMQSPKTKLQHQLLRNSFL